MAKKNILFPGLILILGCIFWGCSGDSDSGGEVACTPQAGQCPNICQAGIEVEGGPCQASSDCACGFSCNGESGTCQPYTGQFEGCSCESGGSAGSAGEGGGMAGSAGEGGSAGQAGMGGNGGSAGSGGGDTCPRSVPDNFPCNPYCNTGVTPGSTVLSPTMSSAVCLLA